MEQILIYIVMLSTTMLLLSLSHFLIQSIKLKRKELVLDEFKTNISANIQDGTFGLLDIIIQECFNEYIALNIEFRQDINYIDGDLEKIITQDVAHKVIDRVSPTLMSRISLVYNINNFDQLLSERTYLVVMNYAISKNMLKKEE